MPAHDVRISNELLALCQSYDHALFEHRVPGYKRDEEIEFLRRHHLIVSVETMKRLLEDEEALVPLSELPDWLQAIRSALSERDPPRSFDVDGDLLWQVLTTGGAPECVCHLVNFHRCADHPQHARFSGEQAEEVPPLDRDEEERWRGLFFKHSLSKTYTLLQEMGQLTDLSTDEA